MRFLFAFAIMLTFISTAHAEEGKKTLQVGMFTWAGNGLFHVAQHKKFFGDLDVQIKVIDDVPTLINAYRSEQIDVMNGPWETAALLAGNGTDAYPIYSTDNSFGADGVVANAEIKSMKDLKGKKVGFAEGTFQHFFLHQILTQNGMNIADIEPVLFNDPSLPTQALLSGKIDAAVAWEPYLSQASKNGYTLLASSKTNPGVYFNSYSVSKKILESKSEELKTLIAGLAKAAEYVAKNKDESAAIIAKGFPGMKKQEVLDTMDAIYYLTPQQEAEYYCGDKPKAIAIYNEASRFWLDQKITKKDANNGKAVISKIGCPIYTGTK